MKNLTALLFFLALLLMLGSCASLKHPQFKQLTNVKFNSWNKGKLTLRADAEFDNPNPYKFHLTATDINLLLNGKKAAHVEQEMNIKLPASKPFTVPINIEISTDDLTADFLLDGAMAVLTNKKIPMQLNGTVTVKFFLVKMKIPVKHEQQISVKDLM
ncbi:MAG: LEA type 2 family protein [Sphingobacteriales bacterium]|nr:MAG: LEA type 2 family protein [Sphingobacteriales bacterium]